MNKLTMNDYANSLAVAAAVTGALAFFAAQEGGRGAGKLAMELKTAHVVLGALAGAVHLLATVGVRA